MNMQNQTGAAPSSTGACNLEHERELAALLVDTLNLDLRPADIASEAPLFGDDGIGLDSIDVLEIALALSKKYGVELHSDDENNTRIFASLRSLSAWIQQHRTR